MARTLVNFLISRCKPLERLVGKYNVEVAKPVFEGRLSPLSLRTLKERQTDSVTCECFTYTPTCWQFPRGKEAIEITTLKSKLRNNDNQQTTTSYPLKYSCVNNRRPDSTDDYAVIRYHLSKPTSRPIVENVPGLQYRTVRRGIEVHGVVSWNRVIIDDRVITGAVRSSIRITQE